MRIMRMFMAIMLCFAAGVSGGIIEESDNDPKQEFVFSACDPDSFRAVIVGVSINLDSGYWETEHLLTDTVHSETFGYIASDIDSRGRWIPGHYQGEYWFYVIGVPFDGAPTAAEDTLHVSVAYDRRGGCGGIIGVFRRD